LENYDFESNSFKKLFYLFNNEKMNVSKEGIDILQYLNSDINFDEKFGLLNNINFSNFLDNKFSINNLEYFHFDNIDPNFYNFIIKIFFKTIKTLPNFTRFWFF
jgi:hypothetical protein